MRFSVLYPLLGIWSARAPNLVDSWSNEVRVLIDLVFSQNARVSPPFEERHPEPPETKSLLALGI
jgi:hypothetical protein